MVACVDCQTDINVEDNPIPAADFRGVLQSCPECGSLFDWWEIMLSAILHPMPFGQRLAPVGARVTIAMVLLRPNQTIHVEFSDHGVPETAQILLLNYTPQGGGLFPLESHGNTPRRHGVPSEVTLFPQPIGQGPHEETVVAILVVWVPIEQYNPAWHSLVEVFEAFHSELYEEAIVPANVAVESKLNLLLSQLLNRNSTPDRVREFLISGATYGHQLNVLLPTLVDLVDAPALPTQIRQKLHRLNQLRNQVVHGGHSTPPPNREQVAEYLCAALLGYRYVQIIEPLLLK